VHAPFGELWTCSKLEEGCASSCLLTGKRFFSLLEIHWGTAKCYVCNKFRSGCPLKGVQEAVLGCESGYSSLEAEGGGSGAHHSTLRCSLHEGLKFPRDRDCPQSSQRKVRKADER